MAVPALWLIAVSYTHLAITVRADGQAVNIPGLKLGGTYFIKETNTGADYSFVNFTGEGLEDKGNGVYQFTVPSDASAENVFAITCLLYTSRGQWRNHLCKRQNRHWRRNRLCVATVC